MSIEQSRDPEQFAAFELSGWDHNIIGYDAAFGAVARQTVAPMLDAVRVEAGMDLLDVCCGPGVLTAGAAARGARATGLDFSSEAVKLAGANVPNCRFQQGDAQALPFANASFDAVVCCYGLMHLPSPEQAMREALRVLRPGGRSAFAVWDSTGSGFSLVYEAVRARGRMDFALPHGPDFFQFGAPERMSTALAATGYADTAARSFAQSWRIKNADQYVDAIITGTVRARAVLAAQAGDAALGVRAYIADFLARFRDPSGDLIVPMPAIIGSGLRPW
jgi:ubiquinone/menaquinone biosynthesis C-methylase UbiE